MTIKVAQEFTYTKWFTVEIPDNTATDEIGDSVYGTDTWELESAEVDGDVLSTAMYLVTDGKIDYDNPVYEKD